MLKRERRRILFATVLLLCSLVLFGEFSSLRVQSACSAVEEEGQLTGRMIDVYTGKEPYSGRGLNQESDAFEPQEEVFLYGLVTYNRDPVPGKIVAFYVHGPANPFENITLSHSAMSEDNGLAQMSFSMPWPDSRPKAAIFGVWTATASVDIAGVVVNDTVSFKVGWIIELLYVKSADVNGQLKNVFSKGERVAFRLGVRNIAMTQKTATLSVSASDELDVSIGVAKLENEAVPPGEREYLVKDMAIPLSAFSGEAKAVANALKTVPDSASVPWCPAVETTFWVGLLHDVAVLSVVPSVSEVSAGEAVNITVAVKNEGQGTESFNVLAFYNSSVIGMLWVDSLVPDAERTLRFTWHTGCVQAGEYVIRAEAGPVPGETLLDDNVLVDGTVKIKSAPYLPPYPPVFDSRWVLALLFILIVLVGALIIAVILVLLTCRRRRKDEEEKKEPVEEPRVYPPVAKKCSVCGREFPAVYTFCPYCMSFHGKDN